MPDGRLMLEPSDQRMYGFVRSAWAPLIVVGLLIVLFSLGYGIYTSTLVADYFSNSKAVREAAGPGSQIVNQQVFFESTFAWLPGFKFFGMGLLFAGIVAALAIIILTLKGSGAQIQQMMGAEVRAMPRPLISRAYPWLAILGLLILAVAFGVSIYQAVVAASYWNNSIANTLDPAPAGSQFLAQLSTIESIEAWNVPLKFVGIATLLTSISFALFTIQSVLRGQSMRLLEMVEARGKKPAA
ncbi:MAG: hypothetical protein IBX64_04800 [Actinobacteria bacterium]|nr:hypothetical protein [Actinomycetota bacterium]